MADIPFRGASAPTLRCEELLCKRRRAGSCANQRCKKCCLEKNGNCKFHAPRTGGSPSAQKSTPPSPQVLQRTSPIPAQQPMPQMPAMVDIKEIYLAYQKEMADSNLWRSHALRQIDEDEANAQDEAMRRYKRNVAILSELFDGQGPAELADAEARAGAAARMQYITTGLVPPGDLSEDRQTANSLADISSPQHRQDPQQRLLMVRALRRLDDQVGTASSPRSLRAVVDSFEQLVGPSGPRGLLTDLLDKMGNAREQEVEGAEEPPEANGASVCRFQNGEDREQEPSVAGPVPEEEASGLLGKRCMSSNGIPGEPRLGIVGAPAASAASRDPQLVGSGQAIEGPKRPLCLRQLVRKVEVDPGTRPPPLYHPIRL